MGTFALDHTVRLTTIACCQCGIIFGLPASLEESLRKSHDWFFCPAGHTQHFTGESDVERLQKEKAALQKKLEWAQRSAQLATDEATKTAKKLDRANKERKALKKRIKEGLCPCCHESFPNLQTHMQENHPDFEQQEEPNVG
jgi:hypothetical protein